MREDLILIRKYPCDNAFVIEEKFHKILTEAGCHHQSKKGGIEWFIELVDAIAEALDLDILTQ